MHLPRIYAIIDRISKSSTSELMVFVEQLLAGGVTLMQYRNKQGIASEALSEARELERIARKHVKCDEIKLIMNDRADMCIAARFDGVHLGQDDLSPEGARLVCPVPKIVGVSTHTLAQMEAADASSADYIAFGPVFATSSKTNPDPVVGLEGLRQARKLTTKPLVAIGGITTANCRQAIDAGADSVAVISALAGRPRQAAEEFLRLLT